MDNNIIIINEKIQLDIFEKIFLNLLEIPSMRWKLKDMIESRDKIDNANLDLRLKKLELEIFKKKEASND